MASPNELDAKFARRLRRFTAGGGYDDYHDDIAAAEQIPPGSAVLRTTQGIDANGPTAKETLRFAKCVDWTASAEELEHLFLYYDAANWSVLAQTTATALVISGRVQGAANSDADARARADKYARLHFKEGKVASITITNVQATISPAGGTSTNFIVDGFVTLTG